jgi:hypothetical protein
MIRQWFVFMEILGGTDPGKATQLQANRGLQ